MDFARQSSEMVGPYEISWAISIPLNSRQAIKEMYFIDWFASCA